MDREVRGQGADEATDPDVLHDGGIDPARDDAAEVVLGVGEFVGEDEGVEGDVALDAAAVEKRHQRGQVGLREVFRAHAGIEAFEAEVDRVGPVFEGGARALPVAGGSEEFGAFERGRRSGCVHVRLPLWRAKGRAGEFAGRGERRAALRGAVRRRAVRWRRKIRRRHSRAPGSRPDGLRRRW